MIYDRLRVFVSSKMAELAPERAAIKEVLDALNIDAWVFEEDAGARPGTIQEAYTEELEAADLYIGVFWRGYGGYTVDEFEHAQKTGKDCLVYQKGGGQVIDREPELQAFLERIGSVETGLTVQFFETTEELREMVKRDAARWQMRIVRKYRESGPQRTAKSSSADPNLVILRNKVQQFWVDAVLGHALDTGLVELSKEDRPKAVDQPWEAILELPYEGSRVVQPGATLLEIFDDLQSSLLVLGQPGSGKTTTALQLTRDLIERSEHDPAQPVPVVLNLSTWSLASPSFLAWIAREISGKYQIPGSVSRPWLELGRLVLILDGLDEVAAGSRAACVAAINRFGEECGLGGLVVTSRLEEYDALPARLRTNGAICLQPLGPEQVDAYLREAGADLDGLRSVLKTDETLRELARSPLMLSVMSIAYRGRSEVELAGESGSAEERRARLFSKYVERAFEERATERSFSRDTTMAWLSWLARRMSRSNQSVFLIEDIQPSWLARRAQLAAYLVGLAALFGLVYGGLCILYRLNPSAVLEPAALMPTSTATLPASLDLPFRPGPGEDFGRVNWIAWQEAVAWIVGCMLWFLGIGITDGLPWRAVRPNDGRPVDYRRVLANVLLFGLLWVVIMFAFLALVDIPDDRATIVKCLPAGLTLGAAALCARRSLTREIRTTESLGLNWAHAARGAAWGLPIGLGFGAIGFFFLVERDPAALVFWPLLAAAFGALLAGLEPRVVKGKTVPNQGMLLTIRTSLRAGRLAILLAATVVLACAVRGGEYWSLQRVATWAAVTFLFFFVILAMWFGGMDLVKHLLVRSIIGFTRQGPYDFPRLLDDASRRNLMQRVGSGYIFAHRLLLDHFAALDVLPPSREESHNEGLSWLQPWTELAGMTVLAAAGLALLLVGLQNGIRTATVLGGVTLGICAQWLVVRTAVTSALRAARSDERQE